MTDLNGSQTGADPMPMLQESSKMEMDEPMVDIMEAHAPADNRASPPCDSRLVPLLDRIVSHSSRGADVRGLYSLCLKQMDLQEGVNADGGSLDDPSQARHTKLLWQSCSLYIVKAIAATISLLDSGPVDLAAMPSKQHSNGRVPLTDICIVGGIPVQEFMEQLPAVAGRLQPLLLQWVQGQAQESSAYGLRLDSVLAIPQWQQSLREGHILAKKLRELLERSLVPGATQEGGLRLLRRWGWLLFINLKARRLPMFPDRVSCMKLLVLVVNTVITQLPSAKWLLGSGKKRKLNVLQAAPPPPPDSPVVTLEALSALVSCDPDSLHALAPAVGEQIHALMEAATNGWRLCTAGPHPESPSVHTQCSYFEGLLTNGAIQQCSEHLDTAYRTTHLEFHGELDERPFVHEALTVGDMSRKGRPPPLRVEGAGGSGVAPWHSQISSSGGLLAGRTGHSGMPPSQAPRVSMKPPMHDAPQARGPMMLHSPMPLSAYGLDVPTPRTPMTATMNASCWLRTYCAVLPDKPSQRLQMFFDASDRDVGPVLAKRVQEMAKAVIPAGKSAQEAQWSDDRRVEGLKLYWKAMESMLVMERERASKQASVALPGEINLTSLLTSFTFHKCLAAFAFEMVIAAHSISALAFPEVLTRLRLNAFDFCNLIERYVKCEPDLPFELKRHLFLVEEEIIEKLAWQRRSSLYTVLLAAGNSITVPSQQDPSSQAPALLPTSAPIPAGAPDSSDACTPTNDTIPLQDTSTSPPASSPPAEPNSHLTPAPSLSSAPTLEDAAITSDPGPSSPSKLSANLAPESSSSAKRQRTATGAVKLEQPLPPVATDSPYPVALGPPDAPGADGTSGRVVHEFFRKVLKLCAFRLAELCEKLEVESMDKHTLATRVYYIFQHALQYNTYLLYNRHLDQILLCCLYGYCKVKKVPNVSFREITNHYKKKGSKSGKEGGKEEVFRNVVLRQEGEDLEVQETGDIIAFYNQVFVPAMKAHLLKSVHDATFAASQQVPTVLQTAFQARQSPKVLPYPIFFDATHRPGTGSRDPSSGPSPRPRMPLPRMPAPLPPPSSHSQAVLSSLSQRRPIFLQGLSIPGGTDHSEIPIIPPAVPPTSAH